MKDERCPFGRIIEGLDLPGVVRGLVSERFANFYRSMSDPRFEALGPEQFQQFCQSLLTYEFPTLQALEVGQRDGGRDAFQWNWQRQRGAGEFGVFQVKFVRRPTPLADPLKWIQSIVKAELPKINTLVERGATFYRLMTNAPGTPHLDTGSVDKVQQYLSETLPVPAECFWRNDLAIRVAKHPSLRWGYPDLLSPTDILRELITEQIGENAQRRTNAIQTVLQAQYKADRVVRFKQVDIQNDLLNLFIDVPATVQDGRAATTSRAWSAISTLASRRTPDGDEFFFNRSSAGAAEFLCSRESEGISPVVVEGAPGQGKSTLAQYLCQVHRMRLLRKSADLKRVPDGYSLGPVRLPFKVDLRQLAGFLRGRDPFSNDPEWAGLLDVVPRTIEGFLAATITRHSGGISFDVADLQAVFAVSNVLIVYDGLDEVADLTDRQKVIEAIEATDDRLHHRSAFGLQTIVTSRPAASAKSPSFSPDEITHLTLTSITKDLALKYSNGWSNEHGLDKAETTDLQGVLRKQLDQPHIRDLARNPMQLAILLNLIRSKGDSLPDKRTDLYASYMEKFFDREAEKSAVVRDHREVLVAFHEFLAWSLHCGAELDSDGGGISETHLRTVITEYLTQEEVEDATPADIYEGVTERVMAVVSRVEGEFEFQVQPLREYFGAAFLYKTAQISRVGHEHPGDLLDRFDGLSRDPFWLNVVRFYAGFYNSGQLPSLAFRLKALNDDPAWGITDRPRLISSMLLGDWSFAPEKDSRREAIDLVLKDFGRRHDLTSPEGGRNARIVLPMSVQGGVNEAIRRCWELLDDPALRQDRHSAIATALRRLSTSQRDPTALLERVSSSTGSKRTEWLQVGLQAGILRSFSVNDIEELWSDGVEDEYAARSALAVSAGLGKSIEADEAKAARLLSGLLDGQLRCFPEADDGGWLGAFGRILIPFTVYDPFRRYIHPEYARVTLSAHRPSLPPTLTRVREITEEFLGSSDAGDPPDFALSRFLDRCQEEWGDGWALRQVALSQVASEGRPARSGRSVRLGDSGIPILRRLRYARTKGGASSAVWWEAELGRAGYSESDRKTVLTAALSWPSKRALQELSPLLEARLNALPDQEYSEVLREVSRLSRNRGVGRTPEVADSEIGKMDPRLALSLARRDPNNFGQRLYLRRFKGYRGADPWIKSFRLDYSMSEIMSGRADGVDLQNARRGYREGDAMHQFGVDDAGRRIMPLECAKTIVEEADYFALSLVQSAEYSAAVEAGRHVIALGQLADMQEWFP